ncbi:MAG TPA: hypothetical protein VGC97_07085 [Pyrinomonadaceae bacterium]
MRLASPTITYSTCPLRFRRTPICLPVSCEISESWRASSGETICSGATRRDDKRSMRRS